MKVIIAGSRSIKGELGERAVRAGVWLAQTLGWEITEVVCGKARGIDTSGEDWANRHGIPVKPFPVEKADWQKHGDAAGPLRNAVMAKYADALLAVTNGSSGTANMIKQAKARNLPVIVIEIPYIA